jgi:hypothetical protein
MYSVHISTTDDRDLPMPDLGLGLTWERLTETLRREVSPEAAVLLSEPVRDEAMGQTHWHVMADGDPVPLTELNENDRAVLLDLLAQRRRDILNLATRLESQGGETNLRMAHALRAIVEVPDEDRHVWSVDRKPVLTAWGRRPAGALTRGATIVAREALRSPLPPQPSATIAGSQAAGRVRSIPGEPAAVIPRSIRFNRIPWVPALLWMCFVLLVGVTLYNLLAACAIDLPLLRWLTHSCQLSGTDNLAILRERNASLRDGVRAAELEVAALNGDCAPPRRSDSIPPRSDILESQRPDTREVDERRRQARGTHGKLDITLAWNGREDLDLHVVCPDGEIWANTRDACGGKLEIDRNANALLLEDTPVEHVTWAGEPPPGNYRVDVVLYNRFDLAPRQVPFTIVIRNGDNEKTIAGTAGDLRAHVVVAEFQR